MSEPFNTFQYIYPPRTKMLINSRSGKPDAQWADYGGVTLDMWRKFPDSIAQFKLNESRNLTYYFPDGHYEMWNRHAQQQAQYAITPAMKAALDSLQLPKGQFTVLDGGILHAKTKTVKDVLYVWDVLVYNGQWLLGEQYGERKALLHRIAGERFFPLDFNPQEGSVYVAQDFTPDLWETAWGYVRQSDYCEGLVLKRTGALSRLEPGMQEYNNSGFMCRIRKPNKNYR